MPFSEAQKTAVEEVIQAIVATTAPGRGKRRLADMFMELVDRDAWPEYYEVIPEPRCLRGVRDKVAKGGYRDASDIFADLSLVFLNAVYYNEEGSQIAADATTLKTVLDEEWKKRPVLPTPRDSLPPSSPQKTKGAKASSSKARTQAASVKQQESQPTMPATPKATTVRTQAKSQAPPPQPTPTPAPVYVAVPSSEIDVDVDVDVEGGPSDGDGEGDADGDGEGENLGPGPSAGAGGLGMGEDLSSAAAAMARDAESDEIVHQLERGLRKWEGFGDKGWTMGLSMDRCLEIVHAIKGHKDVINNNRVAAVLDSLPEESTIKVLSFNYPLSLKIIENKIRTKQYPSSKEFDLDMARLFEKGRRSYEICSDQYGDVLLLQRLYQALTSPTPPSGPPYTSQSNFASIRAGPGTARPLHAAAGAGDGDDAPGVTTFRVSNRDRRFVEEVHYKGWSVRLADWLHLANPDDPSRPIVAQVFKCWVSEELAKKGQPGVTVCWYYRPEQTFHPANRQFWEGEVFKTGHFADHPLSDIIEKIACQFTARHIRGRPRPPFWAPGWPLYVCDSRYNSRERLFVRIKNWNSCVPEEVRKAPEFMPIYPFERMVFPRRRASPFLAGGARGARAARLPGGIVEDGERAEGAGVGAGAGAGAGDGGAGRKRGRRSGAGTPSGGALAARNDGPSKGTYVAPGTGPGAAPAANAGSAYPGYGAQAPALLPPRRTEDRSVVTAAGGAALGANMSVERLSPDVARHFDRDPDTNEVLWFSGPPLDVARTPPPRHSLAYLHFLALKRKRALGGADPDGDAGAGASAGAGAGAGADAGAGVGAGAGAGADADADAEDGLDERLTRLKRARALRPVPTVGEAVDALLQSLGQ